MRKIFRHGHREEPVFGGRRRFVAGRSRRTGLRRCRLMEGRAGSVSVRRGPGRTGRLLAPVSRHSGKSFRSGSGERTVATGSRRWKAIAPGPIHADQVSPSLQISTVPRAAAAWQRKPPRPSLACHAPVFARGCRRTPCVAGPGGRISRPTGRSGRISPEARHPGRPAPPGMPLEIPA